MPPKISLKTEIHSSPEVSHTRSTSVTVNTNPYVAPGAQNQLNQLNFDSKTQAGLMWCTSEVSHTPPLHINHKFHYSPSSL